MVVPKMYNMQSYLLQQPATFYLFIPDLTMLDPSCLRCSVRTQTLSLSVVLYASAFNSPNV